MLLGMRLYAKKDINNLWKAIESDIRNFYSQKVTPLYALNEADRDYVSIILNVKDLDGLQDFLNSNPTIRKATMKTRTIPFLKPFYFSLPEGHPENLKRFLCFLQIHPSQVRKIPNKILRQRMPKGVFIRFMSYSFGDDDLILSIMATDEHLAEMFVYEKIGSIQGITASSISKIERIQPLTSERRLKAHVNTFLFGLHEETPKRIAYEKEQASMVVIIRLYAKKDIATLWKSIMKRLTSYEGKDFVPMFASIQEAKDYITVAAVVRNFEVMQSFFLEEIALWKHIRKSRTYPLLKPVYFLLPKEHPVKLERYLLFIRAEPSRYREIYNTFMSFHYPQNIYMTYLSYSLGEDDIFISVLTDNRQRIENFVEKRIKKMRGILSCEVSSQLKTVRLVPEKIWLAHRNKYLSPYDKEHKDAFDVRYDWTKGEDFIAEPSVPPMRHLYQED